MMLENQWFENVIYIAKESSSDLFLLKESYMQGKAQLLGVEKEWMDHHVAALMNSYIWQWTVVVHIPERDSQTL